MTPVHVCPGQEVGSECQEWGPDSLLMTTWDSLGTMWAVLLKLFGHMSFEDFCSFLTGRGNVSPDFICCLVPNEGHCAVCTVTGVRLEAFGSPFFVCCHPSSVKQHQTSTVFFSKLCQLQKSCLLRLFVRAGTNLSLQWNFPHSPPLFPAIAVM